MKKLTLCITTCLIMSFLSCTRQETLEESIAIESITLSDEQLSLLIGDQVKLSYTIEPMDATQLEVRWESMDSSVVSIDQSGLLTALSSGQANILLESENGVHATCTVTVEQNTLLNRMVGDWTGYKIEWLDNATGEIYSEKDCRKVMEPNQDAEYYETAIEYLRAQYCFNLNRESVIQIGLLCMDGEYRFVPGTLNEAEAYNTFHASFEFKGTNFEDLTHLYEMDFVYMEKEEAIKVMIPVPGERFSVIRYYKVTHTQNN